VSEPIAQGTSNCPECGAPIVDGKGCRDLLAAILGWEPADAELFSLHFYIVAAFNLQHPAQFTDEALQELRAVFVQALDGSAPVEALARRMGTTFQGSTRVLKKEDERHPVSKSWTVTATDVFAGGRPEGAAYRVRRWASSVRAEM
jgi:hypothetical protein